MKECIDEAMRRTDEAQLTLTRAEVSKALIVKSPRYGKRYTAVMLARVRICASTYSGTMQTSVRCNGYLADLLNLGFNEA